MEIVFIVSIDVLYRVCYTPFCNRDDFKNHIRFEMGVHHMKIAVVASNGKASQLIIKELLSRGHEVTGFARSANRSAVTLCRRIFWR